MRREKWRRQLRGKRMSFGSKVLILDQAGTPVLWAHPEIAVSHFVTDKVLWSIGRNDQFIFRGGFNNDGVQSIVNVPPIVAVSGMFRKKHKVPHITNSIMFVRDHHRCAYCGEKFHPKDLSRDHILPRSRGGGNDWLNSITACKFHNNIKDNQTPEEFGMELLFTPFIPNMFEYLWMRNYSTALPSQTEYLMEKFESARIIELANHYI